MPQHKSAKKRVKTNLKRQVRNRAAMSTLRTTLKNIDSQPKDQVEAKLQSVLDKAVKNGLIHKNRAARTKSRFMNKK